ncbi:hypothetical protein AYI69_g7034 [Smittium culicis]|uniref:Uncharacterized protein n=1 Tax=Smittium culicis TaxID=133412 RepID=A0A1R1XUU7_9FUNG|nr:hypothetical protein AYI69_g7034 [Smittium culicis]
MNIPEPWSSWEIDILCKLRERDSKIENILELSNSYSALASKVSTYAELASRNAPNSNSNIDRSNGNYEDSTIIGSISFL